VRVLILTILASGSGTPSPAAASSASNPYGLTYMAPYGQDPAWAQR
jgi:hypothetical protein